MIRSVSPGSGGPTQSQDEGGPTQSQDEEWVMTMANGLVTKIERVDKTTQKRTEISADEYAGFAASCYALYYMGIRDYAQAVATGNTELAQAYYQGMIAFLGAMGQT